MNSRVSTVFIDALFLVLMILILLPTHKSGPAPDLLDDLVIEAVWEGWRDIDLWVQGPGSSTPVGYSNRQMAYLSLLRDDLGHNDELPFHRELVTADQIADGRYIVNLHYFRGDGPTPVEVVVWNKVGEDFIQIWSGVVVLSQTAEEINVVIWDMLDGALVPGSITNREISIRGQR